MVRTGAFQHVRSSVTSSLHRNSRMLTGRDRDGSDDHWQAVIFGDLVAVAGHAMMEPGDVDAFVITLPALSDHAAVADLVVNCRDDVTAALSLRGDST